MDKYTLKKKKIPSASPGRVHHEIHAFWHPVGNTSKRFHVILLSFIKDWSVEYLGHMNWFKLPKIILSA